MADKEPEQRGRVAFVLLVEPRNRHDYGRMDPQRLRAAYRQHNFTSQTNQSAAPS